MRGLSVDKMHDMFVQASPAYVSTGTAIDRRRTSGIFKECGKVVETRVVDCMRAYAQMWIDSAEGAKNKSRYVHAK